MVQGPDIADDGAGAGAGTRIVRAEVEVAGAGAGTRIVRAEVEVAGAGAGAGAGTGE